MFAGVALCGLASAILLTKHFSYAGLWVGCAAGIFVVVGFCAGVHHLWLQQDTAPAPNAANELMGFHAPFLRVPLEIGKAPEIEWRIENFSDATIRRRGVAGRAVVLDQTDSDFAAELNRLKKVALASGPDSLVPGHTKTGHSMVSNGTLDSVLYDAVMDGSKRLYACGAVVYEDSSGSARSSTCCAYYDRRTEAFMAYKTEFNEIGRKENWDEFSAPKKAALVSESSRMLKFEAGKPADAEIAFRNTGTDELHVVDSEVGHALIAKKDEENIDPKEFFQKLTDEPRDMLVGGLSEYRLTYRVADSLANETFNAVRAGETAIYIWGRLKYRSGEDLRCKEYCYFFDGTEMRAQPMFTKPDYTISSHGAPPP